MSCGFSVVGAHLYLYNNKCYASCPNGLWANATDSTCDTCHDGCELCYGAGLSLCTKCKDYGGLKYYKYIRLDICSLTCPAGEFISTLVPNKCQPCSSTCVTCSILAENCTSLSCAQNNFFLNNSCLRTCPDTYYTDTALRRCLECTLGCQTCYGSGLTKCTKCTSDGSQQFYLQVEVDECAPQCKSGEFADALTLACVPCNSACATCTSLTVCQSCQSVNGRAYFLSGAQCTVTCPSIQFGKTVGFVCTNCHEGCKTCFG